MAIASGFPTKFVFYQNNAQDLQLSGLTDTTGSFVNDASGTATLLDGNREPDAIFQGLTMTYVTGSNGNYVVNVPGTFLATVGTEYTTVIDGDAGGLHFHLEVPTEVRVRTR